MGTPGLHHPHDRHAGSAMDAGGAGMTIRPPANTREADPHAGLEQQCAIRTRLAVPGRLGRGQR